MLYLDITEDHLQKITEEIITLLGGETIGVDLTKKEILIMLRQAFLTFEKETSIWQLQNQFLNTYGLPSGVRLSNQLATVNFGLTKQITDWFASMHRLGGKIPWHKDYINLEPGRQIYFLDKESSKPYAKGTRRIHRVMWCSDSATFGFGNHMSGLSDVTGDDILYNSAWNFTQNGANYAGNQLGFLGYTFDTVLLMQSAETRDKIRFSEFFHNLSGDVLEITPMPGHVRGIQPGMRVFYYYFDESEVSNMSATNLEAVASENGLSLDDISLIANPIQMQIDLVNWSNLSPWAQIFVKELAFARCKYIQGSKWRKVQKIFSTGEMSYEIEFDYDSLLNEAANEEQRLIDNLRADLKDLNISDLTTKQSAIVETAVKINSRSGRLWTIQ